MSLFCRSWLTTSKTSWDWSKPGRILIVTQKGPRVNESNCDDTLWDLPQFSCLSYHLMNMCPMKRQDSWIPILRKQDTSLFPYTCQHIPFKLHILSDPLSLNTLNFNPLGRQIWEIFSHLLAWHPSIKHFFSTTKPASVFGLLYIEQWALVQ